MDEDLCGWTGFNHDEDLLPGHEVEVKHVKSRRYDHRHHQQPLQTDDERQRQRVIRLSLPRHWTPSKVKRRNSSSGSTITEPIQDNNTDTGDSIPLPSLLASHPLVVLRSSRVSMGEASCLSVTSKTSSEIVRDGKPMARASPILGHLVSIKARRSATLDSRPGEHSGTIATRRLGSSGNSTRVSSSPLFGKYLAPVSSTPALASPLTSTCNLVSSASAATVIGQHSIKHIHKLCRNDRATRDAKLQDVVAIPDSIETRELTW